MKGKAKFIFLVYLILFLFLSLLVRKNILIALLPGKHSYLLLVLSFIQRVTALLAFVLLALQIIFGAYNDKLEKRFGKKIFGIHYFQAVVIYVMLLFHTFSLFFANFISRRIIDPFYVYTDFCLLCQTRPELFISLGRIGFWLLTGTLLVAVLRQKKQWKDNWFYFHMINYLLFFLVTTHSYFLGRDIFSIPFYYVYLGLVFLVLGVILQKIGSSFIRNFKLK